MSSREPLPQLGSNLRRLRSERGWTQLELAERAGVAKDTISKLENNQRKVWPRTLWRLSGALGVQVPELLKPEPQVIDLTQEGFGGAQEAVTNAAPQQRQRLVEQDREVALDAIRGWMHERTETMWFFLQVSIARYVTVYRVADGDFLDLVAQVNKLWREVVEEES